MKDNELSSLFVPRYDCGMEIGMDQFDRTRILLGDAAMERLASSRVAVFGIGGVGGHAAEALARSGLGTIDIIDNDTISLTNINRQLIALHSTVGRFKTEVMKERILDINPQAVVNEHRCFFLPENSGEFDFSQYDYVIDAVDTVTAKLGIILASKAAEVPVISCMGAGNKLRPDMFEVADIYETSVCSLARVMRKELRKRGVESLKCVYSEEAPRDGITGTEFLAQEAGEGSSRRSLPGSAAFVPSVAGLIIAGEVIRDLCHINQ